MKKNKLKRHLETNHSNGLDKPVEFFEYKLNTIKGQRNDMTKFSTENKLAVHSLYVAFYQIAKQRKAHTIVEDLSMPVMKEVAKIMIGDKESKKLNTASLPNSTVKRRKVVMSDDILESIVTHVKESLSYLIQLDQGFSTFILSFIPWQISKVKFISQNFFIFSLLQMPIVIGKSVNILLT